MTRQKTKSKRSRPYSDGPTAIEVRALQKQLLKLEQRGNHCERQLHEMRAGLQQVGRYLQWKFLRVGMTAAQDRRRTLARRPRRKAA